jgi:hypothetical protein
VYRRLAALLRVQAVASNGKAGVVTKLVEPNHRSHFSGADQHQEPAEANAISKQAVAHLRPIAGPDP